MKVKLKVSDFKSMVNSIVGVAGDYISIILNDDGLYLVTENSGSTFETKGEIIEADGNFNIKINTAALDNLSKATRSGEIELVLDGEDMDAIITNNKGKKDELIISVEHGNSKLNGRLQGQASFKTKARQFAASLEKIKFFQGERDLGDVSFNTTCVLKDNLLHMFTTDSDTFIEKQHLVEDGIDDKFVLSKEVVESLLLFLMRCDDEIEVFVKDDSIVVQGDTIFTQIKNDKNKKYPNINSIYSNFTAENIASRTLVYVEDLELVFDDISKLNKVEKIKTTEDLMIFINIDSDRVTIQGDKRALIKSRKEMEVKKHQFAGDGKITIPYPENQFKRVIKRLMEEQVDIITTKNGLVMLKEVSDSPTTMIIAASKDIQ